MSLFSRSSKYTIQKASVYLLTATSGVGMLGASQYKAVKSLFDVNTTLTSPTSPLEHSSYPSFPKVHHHHQQAKPIKVIASTEHGFDGHRHPRMRPAGSHHHQRRTSFKHSGAHYQHAGRGKSSRESRSVFPRAGLV